MGKDPRHYQIVILSLLLGYGLLFLDLDTSLARIALGLGATLGTQFACTRLFRLPHFDPRSPLISGLSLCLLMRTDVAWLYLPAAAVTIASKFLIRRDGKHVFNPTNLGLAVMMLCSSRVWVSPGQWGSLAFFAFLVAGLGGLVVFRAARSDVTWAFLLSYAGVLFGRALWLGDPWSIPWLQLQSGALLIFAFLMISDPRTTPDSRAGRVLFALLVALVAGFIRFGLYETNGLIWALALLAPAVPLLNRLAPARSRHSSHVLSFHNKESSHVPIPNPPVGGLRDAGHAAGGIASR